MLEEYVTYLIVNPHPSKGNGIDSYTANLVSAIGGSFKYKVIDNKEGLSKEGFQEYLYSYVVLNYGIDEVVIEAPEARASTLLIPKEYKVHIRLHCPLAVAQKYDLRAVDQVSFSEEIRVVNKAFVVSSPSYALIDEMKQELPFPRKIFVFKNPISRDLVSAGVGSRDYDVIFMGRFQRLKGVDYLNKVLVGLPCGYRVLLLGAGVDSFEVASNVRCRVFKRAHIHGGERFDWLGRSKVLILLSRFENCSMVALESLCLGTRVVAWDVGGNSEIAAGGLMSVVPLGDIRGFVFQVKVCVEACAEVVERRGWVVDEINADFQAGLGAVIGYIQGSDFIYRGLDFSVAGVGGQLSVPDGPCLKPRVLGFSISNEHIEEMWAPVVDRICSDYLYVSLREMGHHKCFDEKFYVDSDKYKVYNWIEAPELLVSDIREFEPDLILFHNGSHPRYQGVLALVKALGVPIVYTELGWLPQRGNIYFDRLGVNGGSSLALADVVGFSGEGDKEEGPAVELVGGSVVVLTQLDNDTNAIVNSPRFRSRINFVAYLMRQIPSNLKVYVKAHPLDRNVGEIESILDARSELVRSSSLGQLLDECIAVFVINSTAMIEALEYDINIYSFGTSILDNKGVVISCLGANVEDVWSDVLVGSRPRRDAVLSWLRARQINVREANLCGDYLDGHSGMCPIWESLPCVSVVPWEGEPRGLSASRQLPMHIVKKRFNSLTLGFLFGTTLMVIILYLRY